MNNIGKVKPDLEKIHLAYLLANFRLELFPYEELSVNLYPDLRGVDDNAVSTLFELKSRTRPLEIEGRKRYPSDYEWWKLDPKQCKSYYDLSKVIGLDPYWIFMMADIPKKSTLLEELSESIVLRREMWVAPWDSYEGVLPSPKGEYNFGLNRLLKRYSFNTFPGENSTLHIAKTITERVKHYFID